MRLGQRPFLFPLGATGKLIIEVDGFVEGVGNTLVFGYPGDSNSSYAPDLVGFDILQ